MYDLFLLNDYLINIMIYLSTDNDYLSYDHSYLHTIQKDLHIILSYIHFDKEPLLLLKNSASYRDVGFLFSRRGRGLVIFLFFVAARHKKSRTGRAGTAFFGFI
jgi:hypothetical protein